MILALTLAQLGGGLLAAALLLHPKEVGLKLLQLLGSVAILLLAPWGFTDLIPATAGRLLWGAALATLIWFFLLGRAPQRLLAPVLAAAAALASGGLTAAVLPLGRPDVPPSLQSWLLPADALTSALLLGSTLGAMLLGHSYLVTAGMSPVPLMRLAAVMGLACVTKVATVIATLLTYPWPASPHGFWFAVLVPPGLFFVIRVLLGVAGPLALTPLVWKTARIHSTQSATGILYASVVLVLIGELSANFLLIQTPLPF